MSGLSKDFYIQKNWRNLSYESIQCWCLMLVLNVGVWRLILVLNVGIWCLILMLNSLAMKTFSHSTECKSKPLLKTFRLTDSWNFASLISALHSFRRELSVARTKKHHKNHKIEFLMRNVIPILCKYKAEVC